MCKCRVCPSSRLSLAEISRMPTLLRRVVTYLCFVSVVLRMYWIMHASSCILTVHRFGYGAHGRRTLTAGADNGVNQRQKKKRVLA